MLSKAKYTAWCIGITTAFFGSIISIQMICASIGAPVYI